MAQHISTRAPLTERGSAARAVHRLEKALRKHIHLEEQTPLPHQVLLPRNILNPLAVVRIRRCPQRRLVELASEVHNCNREACFAVAATFDFDWEDWWVRLCVVIAVRVGAVAEGATMGRMSVSSVVMMSSSSSGIRYNNNP